MHLTVGAEAEAMSAAAARHLANTIQQNPQACLMVATGNTPVRTYEILAGCVRDEQIDVSGIRVVQLDEYADLQPDDPRSLYGWMDRIFLQPLGIDTDQVIQFRAHTDPEITGELWNADVNAAGGIDVAILGLGPNGHVGFNEPPSSADAPTRRVKLSPASKESNRVYYDLPVPDAAFTAGMDSILRAREVVLLVSGSHKRNILRAAMQDPPTEDVPASWLQQLDDRLLVFADRAAWCGSP